jgi:hypothetical protein
MGYADLHQYEDSNLVTEVLPVSTNSLPAGAAAERREPEPVTVPGRGANSEKNENAPLRNNWSGRSELHRHLRHGIPARCYSRYDLFVYQIVKDNVRFC